MKKFLTIVVCAAAFEACQYDDSELWQSVDDLTQRVEAIESSVGAINSQIETIGDCLDALSAGKVIMKVTPTETGYDLTMSDGSVISISNGRDGEKGDPGDKGEPGAAGQDGQNGADGHTPVIGVRQAGDGLYYWTVDGEWLLDAQGNQVLAEGRNGETGAAGEAGHTPVIGAAKDDDGAYYWTVDGEWLVDAQGNKIKASAEETPESLFASVVENDKEVVITLTSGTVITLPKLTGAAIAWVDEADYNSYYGDTQPVKITAENIISATVTAPYGWSASVNLSKNEVNVTAPWVDLDVEYEGYIAIIAVTKDNIPVTISKRVTTSCDIADATKAHDLLNNVIPKYASAAKPFDALFNITEPQDSYCSVAMTKISADAVPTVTFNFMQGGTGQVNIGSSSMTYSGEIYLNIAEGYSLTSSGNFNCPKGSFILSGCYNASFGPYCGLCFITEGSYVKQFNFRYNTVRLINCGTIDTLNVTVMAEAVNYGAINTITDTRDNLTIVPVRNMSKASSKFISKVIEFNPAPGQYGQQGYASQSAAQGLVGKSGMVSLGMFGGYIIFQFDHSVINLPGTDFVIGGNPMATAAEPGAVMVSFDANGNGLADDEWYELKGSLYDAPETVHGYSITYKKDTDNNCIRWTDNQGGEGTISWNGTDKKLTWWPKENLSDEYTLSGNKLGIVTMWNAPDLLQGLTYGYSDVLTDDYNTVIGGDNDTKGNKFDISWAVDSQGDPVKLLAVDFIKVYNPVFAIDHNYPSFNEVSTEVCKGVSLTPANLPALMSGIGAWQNGSSF